MKFDLWIYSTVANELFFICFVFVRWNTLWQAAPCYVNPFFKYNKTTHSFWIMACQPTTPNVPPEKFAALNKPLKFNLKNENPLVPLKAGY